MLLASTSPELLTSIYLATQVNSQQVQIEQQRLSWPHLGDLHTRSNAEGNNVVL